MAVSDFNGIRGNSHKTQTPSTIDPFFCYLCSEGMDHAFMQMVLNLSGAPHRSECTKEAYQFKTLLNYNPYDFD